MKFSREINLMTTLANYVGNTVLYDHGKCTMKCALRLFKLFIKYKWTVYTRKI